MPYIKWGSFYQASWVTEAAHHLLAVELIKGPCATVPSVGTLPDLGARVPRLDPQVILARVLAGLHLGNRMFFARYEVSRVLYGAQDTPDEAAYTLMMLKIVGRVAWGDEFTETEPPSDYGSLRDAR